MGKNAAERETKDGPTFFEEEKNCVQKILLRKVFVIYFDFDVIKTDRLMIMNWQLFTKPKDEVSLLLIGTEITDNDLNEELGGYDHISTGFPMEATNWKMIRYVEKSIDPPNDSITADWLDGIVVAMNYLKSLKYGFCAVVIDQY